MTCVNHPLAPVAAQCQHCGVDLCGICTNFLDDGSYCDKCVELAEADARGRQQSAREERQRQLDERVRAQNAEDLQRQRQRESERRYVQVGMGLSIFMLFTAMGLYAFPDLLEFDEELVAAREAAQRLEDCRLVFEEIGFLLEEQRPLDPQLQCADTAVPNIVSRNGTEVIVSHPNPGMYGLTALYVSSASHEAIMEP
ncbi:MAG: hypothetical protein WD356_00585 [Pseudomonadales bacterium]